MTDHLSHLELSITGSGVEIARLSARCQDLERECKRLVADVNAHEKDAAGMSDLLKLLHALAANDREVLCASFEDDLRRLKR